MEKLKSRKGISPLIASVLLIAFTMSVTVLFSPWATNMIQGIQEDTSQQAVDITRASNLGLEIESVSYNRSTDNMSVVVQNTGEAIDNKTNISVGVIGGNVAKNQVHEVDLDKQEIATLDINVERTYPLETLQVDMTDYSVSRESGIKCTPTQGLVGYWTFNKEQTKNGCVVDISGQQNNGSKDNPSLVNKGVGESYNFSVDEVRIEDNNKYDLQTPFSLILRIKPDIFSGTQILLDKKTGGLGGVEEGYAFRVAGDGLSANWGNGSNSGSHSSSNGILSKTWQEVSWVTNSTSSKLYRNANLLSRKNMDMSYFSSSNQLSFGYHLCGGCANPYYGKMDEVRIYNRSLSQEEIQRLYSVRREDWAVSGCKLTG